MKRKETVGKISSELLQKQTPTTDPILLQREMQQDYIKYLVAEVESGKSRFASDFFVVVITKNERLMTNVFRNYFFSRASCPTPDYDQAVWFYNSKDERLELVWVIPSREASLHLKQNALEVDPSERGLLKFIFEFADGTLYKLAKKLNNEKEDSIFVEN